MGVDQRVLPGTLESPLCSLLSSNTRLYLPHCHSSPLKLASVALEHFWAVLIWPFCREAAHPGFRCPWRKCQRALIDPSSASGPRRSVRCQISSSSYCLRYLRATLCRSVKHDVRRGVPADELRLSELRCPRGHLRTVGASSPQPSADNDSRLPARPVVPRGR